MCLGHPVSCSPTVGESTLSIPLLDVPNISPGLYFITALFCFYVPDNSMALMTSVYLTVHSSPLCLQKYCLFCVSGFSPPALRALELNLLNSIQTSHQGVGETAQMGLVFEQLFLPSLV